MSRCAASSSGGPPGNEGTLPESPGRKRSAAGGGGGTRASSPGEGGSSALGSPAYPAEGSISVREAGCERGSSPKGSLEAPAAEGPESVPGTPGVKGSSRSRLKSG